jgi:hypothetical protein
MRHAKRGLHDIGYNNRRGPLVGRAADRSATAAARTAIIVAAIAQPMIAMLDWLDHWQSLTAGVLGLIAGLIAFGGR